MNKFTAINITLILLFYFLHFVIKNAKLKRLSLLASFIICTASIVIMDTVSTNDYTYSNILGLIFSLFNIIIILPYYIPIKLKLKFIYFYIVLLLTTINLIIFLQNLHPFEKPHYPNILANEISEQFLAKYEQQYFYSDATQHNVNKNLLLIFSQNLKNNNSQNSDIIYYSIYYALNPYDKISPAFLNLLSNDINKRQLFFSHYCFLMSSINNEKKVQSDMVNFIHEYYDMNHSSCFDILKYNVI